MNGRPPLYLVKLYLQLHHHLLLPTDVNFLTRHQVWISVATLLSLVRFSETSENKTQRTCSRLCLSQTTWILKKINKTETNKTKKGWLLSSKHVGYPSFEQTWTVSIVKYLKRTTGTCSKIICMIDLKFQITWPCLKSFPL